MVLNTYEDSAEIQRGVNEGRHRELIGGMWDEIGRLQFEYMVANGLERRSRLIDVGCGSLRGGVHFVSYLDEGRYFGLDSNLPLLQAGYDVELKALDLQAKLPRQNLLCDDEFSFDLFGPEFDFAIAQSLFTHLPVNHIRLCLTRLARKMPCRWTFLCDLLHCRRASSIWRTLPSRRWCNQFRRERSVPLPAERPSIPV